MSNDRDPYLTGDGEDDLSGAGYPTETGIYDPAEGNNIMTPEEWERQIDDVNLRPCMSSIISDVKQLNSASKKTRV